jgi:hypothetical protein
MFGNLDLGFAEEALKVADAELAGAGEQVENAETGLIAEALVDDDEVRGFIRGGSATGRHARDIAQGIYFVKNTPI